MKWNWFKKDTYIGIKVFELANLERARSIETKTIIIRCIEYLESIKKSSPTTYNLNYASKVLKTKKSFLQEIEGKKDRDIVYCYVGYRETLTRVTINNNLMNLKKPPGLGRFGLEFTVDSEDFDKESFMGFLSDLYDLVRYDYGYGVKLSEKIDFGNERKNGTFSSESEALAEEMWSNHVVGVKHGFIKKVYPLNILNGVHLEQEIFKELLQRDIGNLIDLKNGQFIWMLDPGEMKTASEQLDNSKYSMWGSKKFIESDEAMKLRMPVA